MVDSRIEVTDPLRWNADRGGHAADFVSPEGSNLRSSCPSSMK